LEAILKEAFKEKREVYRQNAMVTMAAEENQNNGEN